MKTTQKRKIIGYLILHGSITPKEAEEYFGCMRLAARIAELRAMGYDIETRRKAVTGRDGTVAIIAEYHLKEDKDA